MCVCLMYALQQRTVSQGKDTERALQDSEGAEDELAFGKEEQGQVQHHQHAQICAEMCQAGER